MLVSWWCIYSLQTWIWQPGREEKAGCGCHLLNTSSRGMRSTLGSGEGTDPTLSHRMPQEQQCRVSAATVVSADPTQQLGLSFWVLSHFGITPWHKSCWVSPLPVICSEPGCRGWWLGDFGKFFSSQINSSKRSQDNTFCSPNLIRALRTQPVHTFQARQSEHTNSYEEHVGGCRFFLLLLSLFCHPALTGHALQGCQESAE